MSRTLSKYVVGVFACATHYSWMRDQKSGGSETAQNSTEHCSAVQYCAKVTGHLFFKIFSTQGEHSFGLHDWLHIAIKLIDQRNAVRNPNLLNLFRVQPIYMFHNTCIGGREDHVMGERIM